mmetsp:Transcript_172941/g.554551  ORF Transcript_172941/g.554551 Transcript_172941/m.554551 type:complete len:106 (+) Transcript_172941:211-528(+)
MGSTNAPHTQMTTKATHAKVAEVYNKNNVCWKGWQLRHRFPLSPMVCRCEVLSPGLVVVGLGLSALGDGALVSDWEFVWTGKKQLFGFVARAITILSTWKSWTLR